ncbi:tyrosine--tRNA ligase [Candidatus Woesearchaeota archaeon]|nr:tyrosine--tRNA ligase [Candidatus Woesearchaeota archaeon]
MDTETRFKLIESVGEEILTKEELMHLLESKQKLIAYDGFEPSGFAHIPFAIFRPINLVKLQKAGIKFKILLADYFAFINNKWGGDLETIKRCADYFIEVWKAAGVENVQYLYTSKVIDDVEYWDKVLKVAKHITLKRALRATTIMGRKETEIQAVAQLYYPSMQVADVFHLDVDICQLGLDQRRANVLAREVSEKLNWKKPVAIHHHMLMGLKGPVEVAGYDEENWADKQISSKMSKSKPESAIFIHDSTEEIKKKINSAFCPEKDVANNPLMDYCKHLVFEKFKDFKVEREKKFGGDISFGNYEELAGAYLNGSLHPLDFKNSVTIYIDKLVAPIRKHFEKDAKAKKLYEFLKSKTLTR